VTELLDRLRPVEARVRAAVAERRRTDSNPDDPFRGLYLSTEAIEALLVAPRRPVDAGPSEVDLDGRLARLADAARLVPLDVRLLLVALAPDVDSRFEQFYGYLNDDVSRRRATVSLALRLCGLSESAMTGRARLAYGRPLVDLGLITVDEGDRPFLGRSLRVPDRVVAHLLGDDTMDPALIGLVSMPAATAGVPGAGPLAAALSATRLAYLTERPGASGEALGVAAVAAAGRPVLAVDGARLASGGHSTGPSGGQPTGPSGHSTGSGHLSGSGHFSGSGHSIGLEVAREAVLRGAGVVLGPLSGDWPEPVLSALAVAGLPVLAYGTEQWNPQWSAEVPLPWEARPLPVPVRAALWRESLTAPMNGTDPLAATAHFILGPTAIARAARAANLLAAADGGPVRAEHLRAGARTQNAAGLQRLARRIEPGVGWPDLVLPPAVLASLRELTARARHRERVLDEWRMRPGGGRGRGVTALFAGDSGTGKTMSAEVIAAELGMDLYAVNLATVVDKYVGETEKNLERIFTEAAGVNGVLLFDEADAIFGKRSEVRDAHDRYANIESAYLLQRMETFDGLAVLATNLRANLDDAFSRRLDMVVDFPVPDEPARRALWDTCLGRRLPRHSDVDIDFLARSFELAGGHIRSAAVTAAYLAAASGAPVTMADLVGAVGREYRKLGRLCLEREFGPYLELVLGEG